MSQATPGPGLTPRQSNRILTLARREAATAEDFAAVDLFDAEDLEMPREDLDLVFRLARRARSGEERDRRSVAALAHHVAALGIWHPPLTRRAGPEADDPEAAEAAAESIDPGPTIVQNYPAPYTITVRSPGGKITSTGKIEVAPGDIVSVDRVPGAVEAGEASAAAAVQAFDDYGRAAGASFAAYAAVGRALVEARALEDAAADQAGLKDAEDHRREANRLADAIHRPGGGLSHGEMD